MPLSAVRTRPARFRGMPGTSSERDSSFLPPNMLVWPELRVWASRWAVAIIWSTASSTGPRGPENQKPPPRTRLSRVRLFRPLGSARRQKSSTDLNGPPSALSSTRGFTAASPTVLIAASPVRRPAEPFSFSMVNCSLDLFMSGGSTCMPRRKHSGDGTHHLVGVVPAGIEDGHHVFLGIVGLEIGRPIGDERIADAVGPC